VENTNAMKTYENKLILKKIKVLKNKGN